MSKSDNKTLEKLRDIADEIDNLNLKDPTAWTNAANELLVVSANLPDGDIAVRDMLEAVHQGLHLMAKQVVTDPLTFIDSLADALMAVEKCIGNESDCENLIQDSKHALERILDNIDLADEENSALGPAKDGAALLLSLDDAAALLIQLEPDDAAGIEVLKNAFWGMSANLDYPEVCRKMLLDAAELLQPNQDGSHSIDTQIISAVGQILEDAMIANEDPESFRNASITSEDSSNNPGSKRNEALPGGCLDYMPTNPDLDLLGEFISESTELIATAEEALLTLEADPDDMDAVGRVFRAFHTVKGTSAFLELSLISELGHHAETFLSRVRDKEIRYSGGYADLSLRALDMIKDLIATVQEILAGAGRPLLKPDGYEELKQFLANPVAVGISDEIDETAALRVDDFLAAKGKVDTDPVEKAHRGHPDAKLADAIVKPKAPSSVADNGQAVHAQKRMQRGLIAAESSVRVGTQRLDRLVDMVGELVIAHSMVAQELLDCDSQNLELGKKVAHTSKIVRELQDIGLSMRMVPLKATFNKMARLVRDVSRKLGKNINFIVEGEDTEIDRNLVDIISDPLVHMIRNAVDHGIEAPDKRSKNHKPETGTVKLAAYHSAGCVVVEIEDDGKGLDRGDILCQARQKGFLSDTPESGDGNLTDREVFNLLFEPGFSTAEKVTDVSGRGVGMDVVKNNIESLRGQVEIKSELGKGSVFKMSLPLTLAIIDGMVIRVGYEMYVIPTVSIIRSVKPTEGAISTVLKQGEVLSFHGNLIPLYRLGKLYRIADANQDINDGIIVVVADENRQAGLLIDELVGRHQVVIKSLGETMKAIPGISGGAIMPDGRVGLILDVSDLIRFANIDDRDCGRVEKKFGRKQSLAA